LKDDVQQYGVILFSSLRSELEILKWPISFGLGGRLNSDMVDDYCRNRWTILSEYASYRPEPDQPPKHRFIQQWTIRQVDLKLWGKDSFLDDVERDLEYSDLSKGEQKKALSAVRKGLRRYRKGGF
jgi:hypothetical protein